ncbi:MAG: ribosome silencing factor [Crocinitomicaceae bacterium]|nr:ribosome silencing factor [Crocinitomicaceae bacterium]
MKEKVISSEKLAEVIVDAIQDVKGKSITKLDLRKIDNAVCDYFIICSGESSTQVEGINNSIQRKTREILHEKPWHAEGTQNSEWILLDYVNIVVHIFYKEVRDFYDLEDLWADAERTDYEDIF